MDFTNKVVVVTGAGGDMGTAIVKKFTDLGARLSFWISARILPARLLRNCSWMRSTAAAWRRMYPTRRASRRP